MNILLAVGALVFAFWDGDIDSPDQASTPMAEAVTIAYAAANAPFVAGAYLAQLLGGDKLVSSLFFPLYYLQGFVWGFIAEKLLRARARYRSKPVTKSTQIT